MKNSIILTVAALLLSAPSAFANLDGSWITSSVQCYHAGKSSAPSYAASVNMNIRGSSYSATGSVASFTCNFSGTYSKRGSTARFQILNDGGCSLGKYLGGGFTGAVNGSTMTVTLGQKVADALCLDAGSSIRVRLKKSR